MYVYLSNNYFVNNVHQWLNKQTNIIARQDNLSFNTSCHRFKILNPSLAHITI